jgi:hypothetical protein
MVVTIDDRVKGVNAQAGSESDWLFGKSPLPSRFRKTCAAD